MENTLHTKQERVFGLDVLRFCAIVFVVAAHGRYMVDGTFLYEFPYFVFIDGVDLFFALSGFLIGTILLKEITAAGEFTGRGLLHFWKRRWFRTLPNYYLVLLLNIILVKWHFTDGQSDFSWKYFFFIHNFSSSMPGFFPESWSLSIEECFYLFAPLLLFGLMKLFSLKRAFLITVLSLILVPILFRYLRYEPQNTEWYWTDNEIRKVVLMRLDAIGYGLLAAWLAFYKAGFWKKCRFWCLGLALALHFIMDQFNESNNMVYIQIFYFSLSSFAAMLYLPVAHSIRVVRGPVAKAVTYISKISYSMYLVNLSMVAGIMHLHFPVKNTTDGTIKYLVYWFVVIALSGIIYRFFEKPIMNLRDKFS